MSRRSALVAGLAVAIVAALAAAWLLVGPGREVDARGDMEEGAALLPGDSPLDFTGAESSESASDEGLPSTAEGRAIERNQPGAPGTAREGNGPRQPGTGLPAQPFIPDPSTSSLPPADPGGGVAPPAPGVPNAPAGMPKSARDPTAREAAARARYREPGSLPKAASLPASAKTESEQLPLDMSKLAEPEIWAEYWSREGYSPPAMVKTPVRGKVMSLLTNTQVPGAKVRIFTFFPQGSMLSGPVLPVAMEAVADAHGFFEINLPVPQRWPSDYPQYALSFEFEERRIVDCAAYNNLRAGEHNEIGVFWAPEEPYELEVSATAVEQGLTVAATGRIDPRRWETRRAKSIFPLFGPQPLSASGSKLVGTWDFINDPPYVTLLRSGEPVLTRQCVRTADEVVRAAIDTTYTSLFVEEATLDEVLALLGSKAGVTVRHTDGVAGDVPISLDVGRVSIRQALELVADAAELAWRIDGGAVVFFEQIVEESSGPEPEIGRPFDPVVFPNDGKLTLSGTVVDGEGATVEGAVLKLTVNAEERIVYSDSTGWFSFIGLPDKPLELLAGHERFVPRKLPAVPGKVDMKVELIHRRPNAVLIVTSVDTGAPVTEIWLGGIIRKDAYDEHDTFGNVVTMEPRHLTAADGRYPFESEFALSELHIQAHGFKFVGLTNEQVQGDVDVSMTPGDKIERRPRDYDAAQTPELFQTDEGEGPGLWSLDDDHWVEYTFNFGDPGANFDLVLGVTNHTFSELPLDNEYLFDVDVWVDGNKVGRMQIGSDPTVQQLGRLRLGNLTGQHTIRLMWMNDRYIPGQLDANIRYQSIRFIEVP